MFLTIPQDRILIVDPMGEYAPLVRRLGGQVIEIAPGSPSHINPMDIRLDMDEDESPLSMKADFLLSLCELVVGGKDGLQPIEKTVIDAVYGSSTGIWPWGSGTASRPCSRTCTRNF